MKLENIVLDKTKPESDVIVLEPGTNYISMHGKLPSDADVWIQLDNVGLGSVKLLIPHVDFNQNLFESLQQHKRFFASIQFSSNSVVNGNSYVITVKHGII